MGRPVAFIGLGAMGGPIAAHLIRAGHTVTVFNRTLSRAHEWVAQHGGQAATSPAQAVEGAEIVFCCVGNDNHLSQVVLSSDGALAAMAPGSVLVDHTTASAVIAREIFQLAIARGVGFLDAPVSGGQSGAVDGSLSVMVGGRLEDFERVRPLFDTYARCARLIGPAGSGQLAKMANQICIAGLLQGLAEGLHFAEQAGIDPHAAIEVLSQGSAQSWLMDHRHQTMIEGKFDFGFAVDWMRKDLALALDEGRHNGAKLAVAALVDQFYADIQDMGGQRWDTSSLILRLRGNPMHISRP